MNPKLPKANAALLQPNGLPLPEWRRFFESLAATATSETLQAEHTALAARVRAIEASGGSIGTLLGPQSVNVLGTLSGGNVTVQLVNDQGNPGPTLYYGTDALGVKGWQPLPEPADSSVPYLIPDGETYTVPVNKQALFTIPIDIGTGSTLAVDGILVEVD